MLFVYETNNLQSNNQEDFYDLLVVEISTQHWRCPKLAINIYAIVSRIL